MNKYTELIDRYLRNEMTASEKADFEKQLETNAELTKEFNLQKQVMKGIQRAGLRSEVNSGFKKGSFKTKAGKWFIGVAITVLTIATVMVVKTKLFDAKKENIRYALTEENTKNWSDADKYLESQFFKINCKSDTVIETKNGIVIAVPAGAFLDSRGDEAGELELEIKEAMTPMDIMSAGLSTTSDGKLLETGGMFYINARQGEKNLVIDAGKPLHASIPDRHPGKKMMFFDGKRMPDGTINWVDPKPLESHLVPVDILSLDFYPPHFLDSVSGLGFDTNNKRLTDSIYYSFPCGEYAYDHWVSESEGSVAKRKALAVPALSEEEKKKMEERANFIMDSLNAEIAKTMGPADTLSQLSGEELFRRNCSSCHSMGSGVITGPGMAGVMERVPKGNWLKRYILNSEKMIKSGDAYANKIYREWGRQSMTVFEGTLSNAQVDAIIEYLGGSSAKAVTNSGSSNCEIAPSRIHAIWDKKFNNTLLATKEFEARLKEIFKTCNASLLELYVTNMAKRMYEIDSLAMTMTGNSGVFADFYKRRDGGVPVKKKHLEKLLAYMAEKRNLYERTATKTLQELCRKEGIENAKALEKINEHNTHEMTRFSETFKEELEMNMEEAYRQLGKPYTKIPARNYVSTPIATTGWKNVDAYVIEATINRTTLDYTDPESGKKAVIKYEPVSFIIKDFETYDRVVVYLLPDKLSSFQRITMVEKNIFRENLNELLKYGAMSIGFKGNDTYANSVADVRPGVINMELTKMSRKELQHFNDMNAGASRDIISELNYQVFENKEAQRKKEIRKREEIYRRLLPVVFPCMPRQAQPSDTDGERELQQ